MVSKTCEGLPRLCDVACNSRALSAAAQLNRSMEEPISNRNMRIIHILCAYAVLVDSRTSDWQVRLRAEVEILVLLLAAARCRTRGRHRAVDWVHIQ